MQNDMKSSLSISVCMATYNGAEFIVEQLKSILAQLPESSEVVIADDGSTDATLNLIHSLGDARIRVIATEGTRLGPIYNLERALASATGEVIFLSDQDDVWLPEKVDRCLAALRSFRVGFVCIVEGRSIHEPFRVFNTADAARFRWRGRGRHGIFPARNATNETPT